MGYNSVVPSSPGIGTQPEPSTSAGNWWRNKEERSAGTEWQPYPCGTENGHRKLVTGTVPSEVRERLIRRRQRIRVILTRVCRLRLAGAAVHTAIDFGLGCRDISHGSSKKLTPVARFQFPPRTNYDSMKIISMSEHSAVLCPHRFPKFFKLDFGQEMETGTGFLDEKHSTEVDIGWIHKFIRLSRRRGTNTNVRDPTVTGIGPLNESKQSQIELRLSESRMRVYGNASSASVPTNKRWDRMEEKLQHLAQVVAEADRDNKIRSRRE
ncbi:hypothetical protein B0H14DRAFT_2578022 [Mycena olivaceomarginata]|nr:hypothetical protein B0H14DRAFT_2578022 [Mycena olivaceomarginata]